MPNIILKDDPLWFKNAIIYEVPIRAFADSNGDGIGDLRGLTEKLDYLQDLGINAIWLLPLFPSPLKDDGYDIADYTSINPIYGTLEDFKKLLIAAHQRSIRVIIELIINHTSDQHPWFQRARRAPKGSPERDFYVWSDTPEKYAEARIIFQDFETSNWAWDAVAKAYFWHRFYSHQPDLNYDNPLVRKAVFEALDFWLEMGVDGLRMDAVPYLYEREGTNCENLPETHAFLKEMRSHIDEKYPQKMLLAEANQWPEDAAQYYGDGDECHMNFHFPLMPRLFIALQMEDNFPIVDILQQTPHIPDNCQWALFLRNHDELTLEMVTDEDRDFMYRVYAQDPVMRLNLGIRRRLAPLLGNDRRQIELLNSLLLSLPGTPVLYYGDEIGMGDNVYLGDRNGVRTPMQWSSDRNAGFSRTNPHRLHLPVIIDSEYHYEAVNVEAQRANFNSLWYWMKRLIATRNRFQALGKGKFELLHPNNRKVFAFSRTYGEENIVVVANLSHYVQTAELDLSDFNGLVPVEIFGYTEFPPIGESPYFLSLSPYGFYWFILKRKPSLTQPPKPQAELPTLVVNEQWENVISQRDLKGVLESTLRDYLYTCKWFGGKNQSLQSVQIVEAIAIPYNQQLAEMVWLQVDYINRNRETYLLFLGYASGNQAMHLLSEIPQAVISRLQVQGETSEAGILFDALVDQDFLNASLQAIANHNLYQGITGELFATTTDLFSQLYSEDTDHEPTILKEEEQTNTYILYGDRLCLKLFRKFEEGMHPDLEIRRFLGEKKPLQHFLPVAGALEYRRPQRFGDSPALPMTVGILQELILDTRSGWDYTLDSLRHYFDVVTTEQATITEVPIPSGSLLDLQRTDIPDLAIQTINSYLPNAEMLGKSTAELHIALATETDNPDFAPEPFSSFYQRSIYQDARNLTGRVFRLLRERVEYLPSHTQELAADVLNNQQEILARFQLVVSQKIIARRTRYHGDYHLGQVLYTGKDFIITHFEGKAARSLSERRRKRSPLRDVARMLVSFNYAVTQALRYEMETGMIRPENLPLMEQWAQFWYTWVSAAFCNSYLETAGENEFLPRTQGELQLLLFAYLLEKAIEALEDELNHRPDYVDIPLQLILQLLVESE
ncbi:MULTISPECIES: maltose alpha-D-glucosyltransferase [Cyanophyceae]|uniref:maltose alpha-D-glucosyltransferase n=1 Tax=Cyanophyceae TaxID=3028117 RepID=UPI00232DF410|nr:MULTISPECIES: maltose alpha-D-glucosyltransferase [Cyanophyceae]MDB9317586.1 maltose alpha-D-glucosyltransferase [Nodularia spumigena CS-590/01A]MDB9326622.1 maltose alpha-D-glucosyltransferase [Nodularia spumigena CS-590/02]MDB9335394.1 maltose alpha-D-glucosyltransferase [Nodularia spumigena CS-590/01]MDB9339319.1 maltose alpha-D-glucosyltransferase [Nodularia spumigena CS-589/07]MDB9343406.1 maltose alpha-D-glucosyltransferase [Nodularia spumigena CS-588/06]